MSNSLYDILMGMASNPKILKEATKKAQPKIKKDFDEKVRKPMVQYYLDTYKPEIYKRQNPSPILLAYKTKTKRINDGTMVSVWITDTGIDIGEYYKSKSYYHKSGGAWTSMTEIHSYTANQYMAEKDELHKQYGSANGTVMGSWIIENFEAGIHPGTNGWPRYKRTRRMRYLPKKKGSPVKAAEQYANQYFGLDTSYQYILSELDKMWEQMF